MRADRGFWSIRRNGSRYGENFLFFRGDDASFRRDDASALFGGVLPLVLTIVVWLVLLGTPVLMLERSRSRDEGV